MSGKSFALAISAALVAWPASATVTISSAGTQNMTCSSGVCSPTAVDANLNVADLKNLLASGNVAVTTTGSGVQANDIDVTAKIVWRGTALTLDAYHSLSVSAPVVAKGKSGLSLLTNDGGSGGALTFSGGGHVVFKNLASALSINGMQYTLATSIAMLAGDIAANSGGNFALADDYDASKDGTYTSSPIATYFTGAFEGLGNKIENLSIDDPRDTSLGLFYRSGGSLSDIGVVNATVLLERDSSRTPCPLGVLVASSPGSIYGSYATGTLSGRACNAGGLAGEVYGPIVNSHAKVAVHTAATAGGLVSSSASSITNSWAAGSVVGGESGGLVGSLYNGGTINESFALGKVTGKGLAGGLVGSSGNEGGAIANSYATGAVHGKETDSVAGGFVGQNFGTISDSYSTGQVSADRYVGGLIGEDNSSSGSLSDTYWDTDTSGISDPSQGAGNIANDPGITGLTTEDLQSGLPAGFDPDIWGEGSQINNGLPYLLAIPPK